MFFLWIRKTPQKTKQASSSLRGEMKHRYSRRFDPCFIYWLFNLLTTCASLRGLSHKLRYFFPSRVGLRTVW